MKIFATTLEIEPVVPIMGQKVGEPQRPAVGLEITLLHSSPPEFDLVFDAPAEAAAAIDLPGDACALPLAPPATLNWKGETPWAP